MVLHIGTLNPTASTSVGHPSELQVEAASRDLITNSETHLFHCAHNIPPLTILSTSPLQRLPLELMAEILAHALQVLPELKQPELDGWATLNVKEGPWPYTQICSRWRDFVISLPTFWSKVCVYAEDVGPLSPIILKTILDRAQNHRLDIAFWSGDQVASESHVYQELLEMLIAHSHLWYRVSFEDLPVESLSALGAVKDRLPLLEDIAISFARISAEGVSISTAVDCFEDAPALERAEIHRFPEDNDLLRLPWSQLVHLRIHGGTWTEIIDVLKHLRRIEIYEVYDFALDTFPVADDHQPIELPSLYRLASANWQIFNCLRVANLTEVELVPNAINVECLFTILDRSSCVLNYLSLWALDDEEDTDRVVSLLRAAPTISILRIFQSTYFPSFISQLIPSPNQPHSLLPKLQALSLEVRCTHIPILHFDVDLLVRLVESRRQSSDISGVAVLEGLNFEIDLGTQSIPLLGSFKLFDRFREEGMEVFISTSSDLISEEEDVLERLGVSG